MDTFSPVDLLDDMYLSSFVYASPFGSPSRSCIPASRRNHFQSNLECVSLIYHYSALDAWDWSLVSSDGEEDGQCHLEGDCGGRGAGARHDDVELAHGLQVLHCSSKLFF